MESKHPSSGQNMPDRRKFTHQPEKSELEKAEELAEKLLGQQRIGDSGTNRWSIKENWRSTFGIAIEFVAPYGTEYFVYEKPTQGQDKVLHRVNFEPTSDQDGNIKITSMSSRDLRSSDDLPKDDPIRQYDN
jgi:hypothetical protein